MHLPRMILAAAILALLSSPSHAFLFYDEALDGDLVTPSSTFIGPSGNVVVLPGPGESSFTAQFGPNTFFGHTSTSEGTVENGFNPVEELDGFLLFLPENSMITSIEMLGISISSVNAEFVTGRDANDLFGLPDGAPAFAMDISDTPSFPILEQGDDKELIPYGIGTILAINQSFSDGVLIEILNGLETDLDYRLVINVEEVATIPLPASVVLFGSALAGLATLVRRRRKVS